MCGTVLSPEPGLGLQGWVGTLAGEGGPSSYAPVARFLIVSEPTHRVSSISEFAVFASSFRHPSTEVSINLSTSSETQSAQWTASGPGVRLRRSTSESRGRRFRSTRLLCIGAAIGLSFRKSSVVLLRRFLDAWCSVLQLCVLECPMPWRSLQCCEPTVGT